MNKTLRVGWVLAGLLLLGALSTAYAAGTKSMLGEKMPALPDSYLGESPALEGKPLVLEFWATWCPPCRQSIPHMNKLYAAYKDKGMAFVGLTNESREKVEAFVQTVPIDYPVAFDTGSKLSRAFGIRGIPHAVVVDKEGKVVWEGHPMRLTEADLDKVLAAPEAAPEPAVEE